MKLENPVSENGCIRSIAVGTNADSRVNVDTAHVVGGVAGRRRGIDYNDAAKDDATEFQEKYQAVILSASPARTNNYF